MVTTLKEEDTLMSDSNDALIVHCDCGVHEIKEGMVCHYPPMILPQVYNDLDEPFIGWDPL